MNIASVKLVNSGLKGIIVTYAQANEKDSVSFIDEHVSKKKAPIHDELETAFESLGKYLLDICDYPKDNREKDLQDLSVTGVTYGNKGFVITGKKTILDGDKTINLVTPLISEADYHAYDVVTTILDTIYSETKEYMSGSKTYSDEQLVMKFNEKNSEFDSESFNNMTPIEKRNMATSILEGMGAVVIHAEELGEELEEEVSEETAEEIAVEEEVIEEYFEDLKESEKTIQPVMEVVKDEFELEPMVDAKSSKKSAITLVDGPGDSFKIVANETTKVSTAKRRQA